MPVVEANLIAYTWPLMVAAAVIALGRRAAPGRAGGNRRASASWASALVITGGRDDTLLQGNLAGYAAALGSALCMAFYTLAIGRFAASAERAAAALGADRLRSARSSGAFTTASPGTPVPICCSGSISAPGRWGSAIISGRAPCSTTAAAR